MTDIRYSKDIDEDRLFWEVVPHYHQAQETITKAIQEEFGGSKEGTLNILEIGCGTGLTSQRILEADPRISLTAIDNVESVAEEARKRLGSNGRATFIYADALEYLKSQSSSSYDGVITAMVIHNCATEYRNKVFKEILRILKKDGVFINVDKIAQDDPTEHQEALAWQLEGFKKFDDMGHPELKEKWTKHYLDDEKPGIVLYERDYVEALESAGFSDIKKVYRYQMEATYIAKK